MKLAVALAIVYVVWGSTYLAIAVADRTLPPLLMLAVRFALAGRAPLRVVRVARRRRGGRGRAGASGCAAAIVGGAAPLRRHRRSRVGRAAGRLRAHGSPRRERPALHGAARPHVLRRPAVARRARRDRDRACSASRSSSARARTSTRVGAAVLLVAAFAWAAGSAYARVAPLPSAPFLSAAMQMLCAAAFLAVAGVATGELGRCTPRRSRPARSLRSRFLIVFGSIVAFTAYGWLLQSGTSSVLVSTYAYVNPAVAVFLGWLFVGETVGGREIAAGAVILASVGMLVLARTPDGREESPLLPETVRSVPSAQGGAGASDPAGAAPRGNSPHGALSRFHPRATVAG